MRYVGCRTIRDKFWTHKHDSILAPGNRYGESNGAYTNTFQNLPGTQLQIKITRSQIFNFNIPPAFAEQPNKFRRARSRSDRPQFLLPIEANVLIGPIRIDGEVGYWSTKRSVPQSWIRGMMIGHEFTSRTEAYIEIYDQQDATRIDGVPKGRQATIGVGGRHALNKNHPLLLLLMGGRSFQKVAPTNLRPSWVAYVGVRFLLGPEGQAQNRARLGTVCGPISRAGATREDDGNLVDSSGLRRSERVAFTWNHIDLATA